MRFRKAKSASNDLSFRKASSAKDDVRFRKAAAVTAVLPPRPVTVRPRPYPGS